MENYTLQKHQEEKIRRFVEALWDLAAIADMGLGIKAEQLIGQVIFENYEHAPFVAEEINNCWEDEIRKNNVTI